MSLHSALRKLRSKNESLVLWADAICIIQDDNIEKCQQVRLMARLFRSASSVLAYIGEEADNSDLAFDALLRVNRIASRFFTVDDYPHPFIHELRRPNILISEDAHTFMEALFQRPWFRRVWVVQEVVLAQKLLIVCGTHILD